MAWMERFMNLTEANPPDYLGLHYYGTDGNAAIAYLRKIHERYPQLPVIVHEIASTSRNPSDVLGFTAQLANFMDDTDWIFEYGFFGCMRSVPNGFVSPEAQLMNPDGSFRDLMYKVMYNQPIRYN